MSSPAVVQLRHPQAALWRSEGVLQIGLSEPIVLEQVPPATARLVELLATPHSLNQLADRLPELSPEWLDWLCDQLQRAGMLTAPVTHRSGVCLWGTGTLAKRLGAHLLAVGVPAAALTPEAVGSLDPAHLVILAGDQAEPDRALTTQLTQAGSPYLVVRLEPARAVVGPLVVPGQTSCVRCSDLQLCGLDSDWPQLLAQLCSQRSEPSPVLLEWAIATAAVQVASWAAGRRCEVQGRTLELGLADLRLRARTIAFHPECGCQGC